MEKVLMRSGVPTGFGRLATQMEIVISDEQGRHPCGRHDYPQEEYVFRSCLLPLGNL